MTAPSLDLVSAGPWDTFVPYTGLHLVMVCVCGLAVAGLAVAGRALRDSHEAALRRLLGSLGIVYWICYNIWWNRNGIDLVGGLPLQICDLNGVIAPLALLTQNRWLRGIAYFWTFALTTQAFIQPSLTVGPTPAIFWWFWAQHTIIMSCAVYDLAVRGFRPDWRNLGHVYIVSAIYLAAVIPLNIRLGSDYGFIGNPPPPARIPPFIDALGPWPARAHPCGARRRGLCARGTAMADIEAAQDGMSSAVGSPTSPRPMT